MSDQDNKESTSGAEWIGIGIAFGAGLGLIVGIFTDSLAVGIAIGAGLGIIFGAAMMAAKNNEDDKVGGGRDSSES